MEVFSPDEEASESQRRAEGGVGSESGDRPSPPQSSVSSHFIHMTDHTHFLFPVLVVIRSPLVCFHASASPDSPVAAAGG